MSTTTSLMFGANARQWVSYLQCQHSDHVRNGQIFLEVLTVDRDEGCLLFTDADLFVEMFKLVFLRQQAIKTLVHLTVF